MFKSIAVIAAAALLSFSVSAYQKGNTVVDVAAGNPDFSTLVTAVKAAGLAETLSGDGPFTVFAPTQCCPGKVSRRICKPMIQRAK